MIKAEKVIFAFLAIAMIYSFAVNNAVSQVTDIDGNVYKTVKIGEQEWTAENLNVEHYNNGDLIPQALDASEWSKLTTGAWCYYKNNSENGKIYGKLYNWYALIDPRGLSPKDWHIASDSDWKQLTDYLGDEAGKKMKNISGWSGDGNGTNESGFTGLPGGVRFANGKFFDIGDNGCFWTSSESNNISGIGRYLLYFKSFVSSPNNYKNFGMSARYIKN
jgi:uncharacterized protein (TIGR02145 family)